MCKRCDDFDDQVVGFENSPAEREAFHDWLNSNPEGDLSEFRDSDDWAQAFCDDESYS